MTTTTPQTAYRALSIAADAMGRNNAPRTMRRNRRGRVVGNDPTPAHREVVAAMPEVLAGRMAVEDAYALLHRSDVWAERFPTKKENR